MTEAQSLMADLFPTHAKQPVIGGGITQLLIDLYVTNLPTNTIRQRCREGAYKPASNDRVGEYVKFARP